MSVRGILQVRKVEGSSLIMDKKILQSWTHIDLALLFITYEIPGRFVASLSLFLICNMRTIIVINVLFLSACHPLSNLEITAACGSGGTDGHLAPPTCQAHNPGPASYCAPSPDLA